MQPLEAKALHPFRRALGATRKEIQRRADAKADTARIAALGDRIGDHFLLRRANADEGKPRRLSCCERRCADDGAWLLFQIHRRLVPTDVAQIVNAPQLFDALAIAANDGDRLVLVDDRIEKVLGDVRSWGERQADLGLARQAFEHAAIVQQQPRMIVQRAARRLVRETDNVIDVWRRDISKRKIEARTHADRIERAIEIQTTERKVQEINRARSASACIERHSD